MNQDLFKDIEIQQKKYKPPNEASHTEEELFWRKLI